jgi:FlaA1/EpsC-like NDP-sugar epimerase
MNALGAELNTHRTLPGTIAARARTAAPFAVVDSAIAFLAYLLSLVLRFEGAVPSVYWRRFQSFVVIAIVAHLTTNAFFGLYGRVWQFASVEEARRILGATFLAGGALAAATRVTHQALPLSVMAIGFILTIAGFGAVRFQSRLFGLRRREETARQGAKRVLVVGAGAHGARIVKDMLDDPDAGLHPVAIVADGIRQHGLVIHDVPLLRGLDRLTDHIVATGAEQVLVALPYAFPQVYRSLLEQCEAAAVPMRLLPRLDDAVGLPTLRDIRDLQIEDLVGRVPVQTDLEAVRALVGGKRILVTGAGGSIGSEIVRQVAALEPAALFALDNDETHLHDLMATRPLGADGVVVPLLADIRDRERIQTLFASARPDIVFHAAAHKHVPMLERHPIEAIKTNIIGTINVAETTLRAGGSRFVLISTDKAIDPVSVMGASKRIAERVISNLNGRGCLFSSVRFGNVLGSRGSVIPTFMRQIAAGGPVTVTDPAMTRYFMSIEEAVQLVLQAAALAEGGEAFMLEMGEPVNILSLAERLIRLAGHVPGRDIKIEIIGTRPGERLTEPIRLTTERTEPTSHLKIVRSIQTPDDPAAIRAALRHLTRRADDEPCEEVRSLLCRLACEDTRVVVLDEEARVVAIP